MSPIYSWLAEKKRFYCLVERYAELSLERPRVGFAQALHQLTHLAILAQEAVDLLDAGSRSLGDPFLARTVEKLRVAPLLWRHRVDTRFHALELALLYLCYAPLGHHQPA